MERLAVHIAPIYMEKLAVHIAFTWGDGSQSFAILEVYGIHMRNPKNKKSADSFLSHATINSFS